MKESNISTREYFAAHAPAQVPHWFKPAIRPRPKRNGIWISDDGERGYRIESDAAEFEGENYHNEADQDIEQWDLEYLIQKAAQWPWFWADMVLEHKNSQKWPVYEQ